MANNNFNKKNLQEIRRVKLQDNINALSSLFQKLDFEGFGKHTSLISEYIDRMKNDLKSFYYDDWTSEYNDHITTILVDKYERLLYDSFRIRLNQDIERMNKDKNILCYREENEQWGSDLR